MSVPYIEAIGSLRVYCESQHFKGWDPYDGLNSKVFQAIPFLKRSALCRLVVIQGFKRCPLNLRPVAMVPKGYNTKGLALFLHGYCNLYKAVNSNSDYGALIGTSGVLLNRVKELADLLASLQSKGYSGACWGYNFDWQSRAFFLPKNTPTVVATSFVVEALLEAYSLIPNEMYLETALSSAKFILKDLNRIPKPEGFMFSYSPLDNRAVYNATLLGSKTLALLYHYTRDDVLKTAAMESVLAVCRMQKPNGAIPHSDQVGDAWRDNFHTGFKLESLAFYQKYCADDSFRDNLNRGYEYWISHFFIPEKGIAKYYDTSTGSDLIDLHCVAQAIPTLYKTGHLVENVDLVEKLLDWAIVNMQSPKGYFYFQRKGNKVNKICYMRWPNAWMFYGMSFYILFKAMQDAKD